MRHDPDNDRLSADAVVRRSTRPGNRCTYGRPTVNDTALAAPTLPRLKTIETIGTRDGVTWLAAEHASTGAQAMARLRPWPGMVLPIVAAHDVPAALGGWARSCAGKARYVVMFGPSAPRLAGAIAQVGGGVIVVRCADMADAVQAAGRLAHVGDAVAWTPLGPRTEDGGGGDRDDGDTTAAFRARATEWVLAARQDAWVAA